MKSCPTAVVLVSLVSFTGCVTELDTSTETSLGTVKAGNGDPCPATGCGTNSPHLGLAEFHELEETGAFANAEGFRLVGLVQGANTYAPDVTGMVLVGRKPGLPDLKDQALVGAELIISNDRGGDGFRIKIVHVSHQQTFWQGPRNTLETYELWWRTNNAGAGTYERLCSNPPDRLDPDGTLWITAEAILFTGDRYDRSTLRVTATTPSEAGTWFNFGCSGNVMSKLVLNRHTDASQLAGAPTSRAQRQAMLKMYTSDVCDTGQAFTKQGTPLRWTSALGWQNAAPLYPNSEARWNENGVLCLDTHRLHGSADDMTSQIFTACGRLPACTPSTPAGYLTTSSPAL